MPIHRTVLPLLMLVAVACSDVPTAPRADSEVPVDSSTVPTPGNATTEWPPLEEWELSEKERIAQAKDSSQAVYDSLKVEWEALKGAHVGRNPLLLSCGPLEYAAEVKIIGPKGGDLSIGPHTLSIPQGALRDTVVITGEMPVSLLVSVRLAPHGLRFEKPVVLTFSYKHCNRSLMGSERVAYTDDLFNVLEWPLSRDDVKYDLVTSWIDHFSRYAVAY